MFLDLGDEVEDVAGFGAAGVDEEVAVDVGDLGGAEASAFEPEVVDEFAGAAEFGIFEGAAGAGADGLGGAAFVMGGGELGGDVVFGGVRGAAKDSGDDEALFELGDVAVVVLNVGEGFFFEAAIEVDEADGDDLVEGFDAHGAGVHADGAAEIAGDAFHPFEAAEAGVAGGDGDLFEAGSDTGDEGIAFDTDVFEFAFGGVDDGAADAAVLDEEVGAATDDADGDGGAAEVADDVGEGGDGLRLDPELSRATDAEGGVEVHGFVEAGEAAAIGVEDVPEAFEDGEVTGDAAAGFVDVAGTEGDDEVTGADGIAELVAGLEHGGGGGAFDGALGADFFEDGLAGDAGKGFFTGGIDVGDEELVDVVEGGAELFFEQLGAAVAVGLEEAEDAGGVEALGGGEGGGDFAGVMAVVVDEGEAGGAVADFEAAFSSTEGFQGVLDGVEGDAEFGGEGDGGEGVGDVVFAGDAEGGGAEEGVALVDFEDGVVGFAGEDLGGVGGVSVAVPAVADGLGGRGADFGGDGVFGAVDPVLRGLAEELGEHGFDGVDAVVVVEVFGFDVEDDGVGGAEVDEGAVAFIAFGDEEGAFGVPVGVGAEDGDFGADVVGGMHLAVAEDVGGEGGGGGLAVGASDDDAVFDGHDGGEGFGAADEGDAGAVGGVVGDVVGFDGGGVDDHVAVSDFAFAMGGEELEAEFLEAGGFFGGDFIGATDFVAEGEEEGGEAAHAGASDTDEVDTHGVAVFLEEAEDGLVHEKEESEGRR